MKYIIATKNPSNKKIVILIDYDDVIQFDTYEEADKYASEHQLCRAWGWEILEVSI